MALALGQSLGVRFTELTNSLQIHVSPDKRKYLFSISHFQFYPENSFFLFRKKTFPVV